MKVSGGVPPAAAVNHNLSWRALVARVSVLVLLGQWTWSADAAPGIDVTRELECLALTIYFEARGEPKIGQIAVGHVVMNRVAAPLFPAAVCDVVRQGGKEIGRGCQFTWWCDEFSDAPTNARAWERSRALARRIFWDYSEDPTAGALWYHADYVTPYWRRSFAQGPKIGRHIFYWLGTKTTISDSSVGTDSRSLRQ